MSDILLAMGHHNYQHIEPLVRHTKHQHGTVKPNVYGALTGTFDHWTLTAHDGKHPDDNHIFVWLKVESLLATGKFEAAVNVGDIHYFLHDETVEQDQWPAEGFNADAALSYTKLGLHDSDFRMVTSGALRTLVATNSLHAQRISVYGMTYSDGTGIHDVHRNTGDHDGALIFYFDESHGGPKARWIFLKFTDQTLG